MAIKQKFNVQCLAPTDFSQKEELSFEWQIATNFKFVAHRSLMVYRKNKRQGNHSTKTRAEVRGGGRKPWKQKGTGRARAGSNNSPLWRGGGVIFGPKPNNSLLKLNRKENHITLRTLLHSTRNNLVVLEDFSIFSKISKTKEFLEILKNLIAASNFGQLSPKTKYLVLADTKDSYLALKRSTKNLKNIHLVQQENVNIPLLCKAEQKVILTKGYLESVK